MKKEEIIGIDISKDKIDVYHPSLGHLQYKNCTEGFKKLVKKLLEELGPRFKNRPGGYLRILKAGNNLGDNSPQAYIELTD